MTTLPPQTDSYINSCPDFAWNGECFANHFEQADRDIYGDAVVVKKAGYSAEYHMDCAIEDGIICAGCRQFECECPEEEVA